MPKFLSIKSLSRKIFNSPAKMLKLKRKYTAKVVWCLVLVFIVLFSFGVLRIAANRSATLTLTFQNNGERVFQGGVVDGMTVLDAILASAKAGGINFKYFINPNDETEILTIDGYSQINLNNQPTLFLNGSSIRIGHIHKIFINPGDEIKINIVSTQ